MPEGYGRRLAMGVGRMAREIIELGLECLAQTFEGRALADGDPGQMPLQISGGLGEHRLKERPLRVIVVEEKLLIRPGHPRDPVHPRPLESARRELLPRCVDNPYRPVVTQLRMQFTKPQPDG